MKLQTSLRFMFLLAAPLLASRDVAEDKQAVEPIFSWAALQRFSPIALAISIMALPLLPLVFTGPANLAGAGHAIDGLAAVRPGYVAKRSADGKPPVPGTPLGNGPSLMAVMARIDEALQRYDVSEPECQLRAICELHREGLTPQMGAIADQLVRVLGVEQRIQRSSFPVGTRTLVQDFLKAARYGMTRQDCAQQFSQCPQGPRDGFKGRQ